MKKIMIIGCGGSGKSTFAKQLHQLTGLELIHLDKVFWKPGWKTDQTEIWIEKNKRLLEKENWIMDGNYGSTMDIRMEKADTIVFMDTPTYVRFYRVIKRAIQYYGQTRPDMPEGCPEGVTFEFLKYILLYNKTRRPAILQKLILWKSDKQVIILRSEKDKIKLLDNLRKPPN